MDNDLYRRGVYFFRISRPVLLLLLLFLLSSCAPGGEVPWQAADLRALEPIDAPDPVLDLIAVYTRSLGLEDQIRLDFLDLPETPAEDVYIALDTQPGGSSTANLNGTNTVANQPGGTVPTTIAFDLLIYIPARGEPLVLDVARSAISTRIKPRITRDPALDTLTVTLGRFDLPRKYSLQVFVTVPGAHAPADQTDAVASDAAPPGRASLLMAFSQTFPAATPAQALRRYDGAHTGPYGERHGLRLLLDAANADHIPLLLLDLKTPASLSALDLTGGLELVRQMVRDRLLMLPDVIYGAPGEVSVVHSLNAAQEFRLPTGKFIYGPDNAREGYDLQFFSDPQATSPLPVMNWNGQKLLGIPPPEEEQTTPNGPTLETRRALINGALKGGIVLLGGDLPDSTWGDSNAGPAGLRYIAAHPWIQPLDAEALLASPSVTVQADPRLAAKDQPEPAVIHNSQGQPTGFDSETMQLEILTRLRAAPASPLTDSAWEMLFLLTAPVRDARLAALNAQYLGDINILLTAADWGNAPAAQSTCSVDLNFDLIPDCVLANEHFFAVFESDGGRLAYLFSRDGSGLHQTVAPGWQFTTGLSDRTQWQTDLGPAADPSQIAGAFSDVDSPWRMYKPVLNPDGGVTFTSAEGGVKTFRLAEGGVQMDHRGPALALQAGLALDPWRRFESGWGKEYHVGAGAGSLSWQLNDGPSVQMNIPQGTLQAFNDTLQFLGEPEDPNRDFPPGHYLPLPMALLEFPAPEAARVLLEIR